MWKAPAWMPWWRTALGWALGAQSGGKRRTLLSQHDQHGMQRLVSAALTQTLKAAKAGAEDACCLGRMISVLCKAPTRQL